jgi:hypothetical protein
MPRPKDTLNSLVLYSDFKKPANVYSKKCSRRDIDSRTLQSAHFKCDFRISEFQAPSDPRLEPATSASGKGISRNKSSSTIAPFKGAAADASLGKQKGCK